MGDNVFCCNCGKEISKIAKVCIGCGVEVGKGEKFCPNCGKERSPLQSICLGCGIEFKSFLTSMAGVTSGSKNKDWLVAVLLSYFAGSFGIDRFYLGYTTLGIIKLLTCGGCGIWTIIDCILIIFNKIPVKNGSILTGREGKEWVGYIFLGLIILGFVIGIALGIVGESFRYVFSKKSII